MTKGTKFNEVALACIDVISVKTETVKRHYTPAACLYIHQEEEVIFWKNSMFMLEICKQSANDETDSRWGPDTTVQPLWRWPPGSHLG